LSNHVLLYHFHLGLSKEAALQLDLSSGGSFAHKSISERKAILEKILENTPYTGIYDEFPKETMGSSSDQQEEAPTTEFEIPSNPSDKPVTKCNTPGVYHQLSSGFKLKHDKLVEMTMPKSNLWK
jgi:hypothetical protein